MLYRVVVQLSTATQWISNCVLTVDSPAFLTHNASVEDVVMKTPQTSTLDPYATEKVMCTDDVTRSDDALIVAFNQRQA